MLRVARYIEQVTDTQLLLAELKLEAGQSSDAAQLVAPLAEETFFRGFVFAGLRSRFGFKGAAIAASGLFAVAHIQPITFVPIFMIGFVLAWIYAGTGSLGAAILVHAAYNGIIMALVLAT
ncbi:MAG: CPBP family intramembrane metalloprotease [Chloroflexi bacterium]|nr:CPBP family intramembrane metalloprotease [Chloroflexota bacterium]